MTAPGPTVLQCPHCYETHASIGASGNAICPDCGHLWDPSDPLQQATPRPTPFGLPTADEVFGAPENGTEAPTGDTCADSDLGQQLGEARGAPLPAFDPAEWVGGVAILEGGQHATIVSFADNETLIVRLANNDLEQVKLADTTSMLPPIPDVEPATLPESEDELTPDLALALRLARVIVAAGAESLYRRNVEGIAELPPTGFLPTEPELLPVIEQAVGMAMAMLIEAFELDPADVIAFAGIEAPETEATNPTETDEQ